MAAPHSAARLPVIRSVVADAVERRTLRGVSAEIGMSHTGLLAFLDGAEPRATTLRKLNAWYVKHAADSGPVDEVAVQAALLVLLESVPERARENARESIRTVILEICRKEGAPAPAWFKG